MMTDQSIPLDIIPGAPLTITVYSGDGNRFARLFKEAWAQLPAPVQEKIRKHWAKEDVRLELSNIWKNCAIHDGEVGCFGREAKFNAAEVDRMPDTVAKALIAHEMAHVYQHATGFSQRTYEVSSQREYEVLESDAKELASRWNFDWVASMQWKAKRELGML